jgi:Uridine phosphorylase
MKNIYDDGTQYHVRVKPGDIGKYVILCGDPGRVEKIAAYLDNPMFLSQNREYTVYNGYINNTLVTVASTGIGGPSAAICVEELIKCGGEVFIRVGTSGGIKRDVVGGDLVIATAAVRDDGTSREYLHESYPAAADYKIIKALADEAETLNVGYHVGVVQSKDSFYGETDPESMPISETLINRWNSYVRLGCLASEMECAAIFAVAQTRGVYAGAVLLSIWNVEDLKVNPEPLIDTDTTKAIKCAVGAIRRIIETI